MSHRCGVCFLRLTRLAVGTSTGPKSCSSNPAIAHCVLRTMMSMLVLCAAHAPCPFCLCGFRRLAQTMMATPYVCALTISCATASATPTTPPLMTHPCTSLTGPTVTAAAARHYWGSTAYRTCSQRTYLAWWGSAGGPLTGRVPGTNTCLYFDCCMVRLQLQLLLQHTCMP
jgi:hypothetical protein